MFARKPTPLVGLVVALILIALAFHQTEPRALFRPEPPRAARRQRSRNPRHTAPYRART